MTWSLWETRATVLQAPYRNDSALHEQMVRFATERLRTGHDPLTSWFPTLGLGSPQFLHYQSTPATLTGLAGLAVGQNTAFNWSLYLLWCLWPVAIYASARLFGLRPLPAALAAVVAPLLHSVPGIGYEQHAYLWAGFGVWTQLWGSWALPFAWALTWRAMTDRRFIAPAAALVMLTAAFHYETGYLAFGAVLIMPFLARADLRARLARAAVLLATALLASAWVVVSLLLYSRWAAINQALATGPSANGYGAPLTLSWLFTGRLLDAGHLPVISLLAAAGLAVAVAGWRRAGPAGPERALIAMLCACLLLSFGRTSFGALVDIVPGHADIFFRRFMMGSQLAAIYLGGIGAEEAITRGRRLAERSAAYLSARRLPGWAPSAALIAVAIVYLVPAWSYSDAYDAANATGISAVRLAQRQDAPRLAALARIIRRGGGRVYAGSPTNWGQYFSVGGVPMYQYVASLDLDEVGYSLRTASLMSQPENNFVAVNAADYSLFGIRYLILPSGQGAASAPVPSGAVPILRNDLFQAYKLPGDSYFQVGDTTGSIVADRADIGSQTLPYLQSALASRHRYLTVAYAGARAAAQTDPRGSPSPAGTVLTSRTDLADGRASATVRLRRPAVVVLSASFDPGWSVTVDGQPAETEMIAPALVGVAVPAGEHELTFRYAGFGRYPELLSLAVLTLVVVCWRSMRRREE